MRWKARTLERSLETATERSLERGQRLVDAAREIVAESARLDFTVNDVVQRAGLSLRAFYQHFAGKEDLLLALYEEIVAEAAARARLRAEKIEDPVERLRFLVLRFQGERGAFPPPISAEVQQLSLARPEDLRAALEPLLALFAEAIEAAIGAGAVRAGDARQHALHLLLTVMIHTQARGQILGPGWPALSGDEVWDYCRRALQAA